MTSCRLGFRRQHGLNPKSAVIRQRLRYFSRKLSGGGAHRENVLATSNIGVPSSWLWPITEVHPDDRCVAVRPCLLRPLCSPDFLAQRYTGDTCSRPLRQISSSSPPESNVQPKFPTLFLGVCFVVSIRIDLSLEGAEQHAVREATGIQHMVHEPDLHPSAHVQAGLFR